MVPEAALTLLIPLGALGVQYVVPISFSIIALLIIVYISYRQTIAAYPRRRRFLHGGARKSRAAAPACWLPRR